MSLTDTSPSKQESAFWTGRRVLVTGGAGFIGSHVSEELASRGAEVHIADSLVNGSLENLKKVRELVNFIDSDLEDPETCVKVCTDMDIVLNLAAKVAGVAYNSINSAEMFQANVRAGMNILEAARKCDVNRFLVVSSACVYSRDTTVPTPEDEGFLGDPEPSNLGYGWAKRVLEVQGRLYASQYGMKIGIARPFNTYGPRDHFNLDSGHVIPALIKKLVRGDNPLVVWGNGEQTRSFVYVSDVVSGILSLIEKYPCSDPVNIGNDEETTVGNLARLIADLVGAKAKIAFDLTKPQGQPRRRPDLQKAKKVLGFEARTPLKEGLYNTIQWYRTHTVAQKSFALERPIADS